jgi:hypothetical protein
MPHFTIAENVEEGLKQAGGARRDDLGYCYHTFRIRLPDGKTEWQTVLSRLVDAGWQMQGAPVIVGAEDAALRHVLISMLHVEPRPLEIRGELRIRGEIHGDAELRGQLRS